MRDVKIGCPAFILRDLLYEDFEGTIKRVGKIGFDGIELIGFFGHPAEEIRNICAENGLEPFGCFVLLKDLLCEDAKEDGRDRGRPEQQEDLRSLMNAMKAVGSSPDEKFSYIKRIGCSYISLGIGGTQTPEDFADQVNRAALYAEKYGLTLQYHNHGQEYVKKDGVYLMDRILEVCPGQMLFEPDVGWMGIAGCGAVEGIRRYTGRIRVIHMKDYSRKSREEFLFRPTGFGSMNWTPVIQYCEEHIRPEWYVCDHDKAYDGDIFEELELSYLFLKNKLKFSC